MWSPERSKTFFYVGSKNDHCTYIVSSQSVLISFDFFFLMTRKFSGAGSRAVFHHRAQREKVHLTGPDSDEVRCVQGSITMGWTKSELELDSCSLWSLL